MSRPRHPRRMRTEATRARKPEAGRARKPEVTRVRTPEATSATEVMRPRVAVSAANWAANLGWVITATKLTGMRPIDRSYRKRGAQQHAAQVGNGTGTSRVMISEWGGWVPAAPGRSLAGGFCR